MTNIIRIFNIEIINLYTDGKKTYFKNIKISLEQQKLLGNYSESKAVKKIIFRETLKGKSSTWHHANSSMYIIFLSGKVKIDVSGGESKIFNTGDIILVSDTDGQGHKMEILESGISVLIYIED